MNFTLSPSLSNGNYKTPSNSTTLNPNFRNFPNATFGVNAVGRIEGYIYDRVGTTDIPAYRRIFLIRDVDALRMRMKFSDPATGFYRFDFLEMGYTYSVIAHDLNQNRNAVIKDKIAPVQMP